jgi:cytochrome c oxidase subunit 2
VRPPAEAIGALALIVGGIAFLIFIGVEAALVYAAWRYRASRMAGPAPQITGNDRLEMLWTAIPIAVLVVVFALMIGTMREISTSAAANTAPAALRIRATGYQWWWQYVYPTSNGDVVVANELHIPVAVPIDLDLASADVVHSYWVPDLAGKTDMIPGRINQLRLYASHAGTFSGQCAEFCGVEHAWMRITVVAEPQADFDKWLAAQASPRTGTGPGEKVFVSNVCASCHTIRGTDAKGTAGPDLTHVGSRLSLAAGVLKNDAASMRAWLDDPQRYKPGSLMPHVPLSDDEISALASYLESLK